MKKICLIEDERPLWLDVKSFLGGVNAEVTVLAGNPSAEKVTASAPNLIITNARVHHELLYRIRSIPVIVIKEGTPPVTLVRVAEERNLLITGWPLRRERFLAMTSRMLSIAPRKVFKSLIRIFTQEESVGSLGQSRDFSLSGLAFRSDLRLRVGDRITVSFSLPEDGRSLRLDGEVVRVTPDGEEEHTLYGARFLDVTEGSAALLSAFILS